MKKPIVVANWKMYVEKPETAKRFAQALKRRSALLTKAEVVVCPPFTLLPTLADSFGKSKTVRLGAQTISGATDPKQTGDISAAMLKAFGATAVIVGHSERRAAGESDESIRAQIAAAHAAKLAVILCIGEKERDAAGTYFTTIEKQLTEALKNKTAGKLLVAYEPIWAIGKTAGDAMQPHQLEEMAIFIRKTLADILGRPLALKVPILYGGSVEGENAQTLLVNGGVAGFLVGHASAEAESFIEIIQACLAK